MSEGFEERFRALGAEGPGLVLGEPRGAAPMDDPVAPLGRDRDGLPAAGSLGRLTLGAGAESLDLVTLRRFLRRATELLRPGGIALWSDLDPEAAARAGVWPGSTLEGPAGARHRPLRQHLELLRLFPFEVLTPRSGPEPGRLIYGGQRAAAAPAFSRNPTRETVIPEAERAAHAEERYGRDSLYRRFDRLAEPEIVDDLLYALASMRLRPGQRVLTVGGNDGRELELLREVVDPEIAAALELWGVDLSASAIEAARHRFPEHAERFLVEDASRFSQLDLPTFHAILVLNTLQCRTLDRERLLAGILDRLDPRGAVLVSIPDCHHGASDILRRPLDRADPRQDRSVVHKEMRFLARYFHRARFHHVNCFGSYDAFILARRR